MTHRPESSEVVFCFLFLENLFLEPAGNNKETITQQSFKVFNLSI